MAFANRLTKTVLLLCLIIPIVTAQAIDFNFGAGQIAPTRIPIRTAANDSATAALGSSSNINGSFFNPNILPVFSTSILNPNRLPVFTTLSGTGLPIGTSSLGATGLFGSSASDPGPFPGITFLSPSQGQDFITFAHQNNIPLAIDSFEGGQNIFSSSLGDIIFDTTDFNVGSVVSNNHGGQNITFINGDVKIIDAQGNIILDDFVNDFLAGGTATLQVQTTNLSLQSGDVINVINGIFSSDLLALIETIQDIAQIESEQTQSENTIRVTSSVIGGHLGSEIANAFGFDMSPGTELSLGSNKLSASSDANYAPDAFWGKHVYSSLTEDGNNLGYSTDLYQFIGGMDKRLGDFFIGSALSYVYGETNQAGNNSSSHTVGITPYVAYKINSFLFASALASYNYTGVNGTQGRKDADIHNYSGEVTLNAFKAINDFIVKGRGGLRYTHNYTSLKGTIDADYDQLTWIGDIEFGYNINKQFNVFTGALYEYIDKESTVGTNRAAITGVTHDGVVYFRSGFNYKVNDKLAVGFDASTDLNDEDNNILTFGANVRLAI